jgi:hypothetical protein
LQDCKGPTHNRTRKTQGEQAKLEHQQKIGLWNKDYLFFSDLTCLELVHEGVSSFWQTGLAAGMPAIDPCSHESA